MNTATAPSVPLHVNGHPAPDVATTTAYQQLIELLGIYSENAYKLAAIETRLNARVLEAAAKVREEYTIISEALAATEGRIESLCRANPTWFERAKGISTPFGTPKLTSVNDLEVIDEETVTRLLEAERKRSLARREEQIRTRQTVEEPFDPELYLRRSVKLNREALETLDDATLARLGIARMKRQSFSLKPAKIDLSKVAKLAAAKEEEAA